LEEDSNGVIDMLPQDLPGVTEVKPRGTSVRIGGVVAEIRTEHFQNINQEHYRYINHFAKGQGVRMRTGLNWLGMSCYWLQ
jgi:hypothetical protein